MSFLKEMKSQTCNMMISVINIRLCLYCSSLIAHIKNESRRYPVSVFLYERLSADFDVNDTCKIIL